MALTQRDIDEVGMRVQLEVQKEIRPLVRDVGQLKDSVYGVEGGKVGLEVRMEKNDKFRTQVKTALWAIVPGANVLVVLITEWLKSKFKGG